MSSFLSAALPLGLIFSLSLQLACTKKPVDGTVRILQTETPRSLDPNLSSDQIAAEIQGAFYEPLYQYSYFKRPYALEPLLAEGMPQFSKDEKTVTVKIKKGIRYQDDPCFPQGKGREVTAQDFIFQVKRLADPHIPSEGFWVVDKKIAGLNEWRARSEKSPSTNYDENIEGLQAPDAQTLVIKLSGKFPQLSYILAMVYTAPVPFEAIRKYGVEFVNHPVGTGPFRVLEYVRNSKIVLVRNQNFHGEKFPAIAISAPPGSMASAGDVGRDLPLADRVEVTFVVEGEPRWLQLMKGQGDHSQIPKDSYDAAVGPDGGLRPEIAKKGFKLNKADSTTTFWLGFNMADPVLGKNKLLRKAIGLAYDSAQGIQIFWNGRGVPANQILPPSIKGFNASIPPREVNLSKAKELLARAGYAGGKGLPVFNFDVQSSTKERQLGEYVKAQLAQLGVNIRIVVNSRPEFLEKKRKGLVQIHQDGWVADYPDAENFMQLLYGPNHPPGPNGSQFKNAEFDKLYEKMAGMQDSAERQYLIDRMTEIMLEESPWIPDFTRREYTVDTGWLKNFVYSDFAYNWYKYLRVDIDQKRELLQKL